MSKIYFIALLVVGISVGVFTAYGVGELGLDPRIGELQNSLQLASLDLQDELNKVSTLESALESEKSSAMQTVRSSQSRISQLEGLMESRDIRVGSLQRTIDDLRIEKEALEMEKDSLQERIIEAEVQRSNLIGQLAPLQDDNEMMSERIGLLTDNIASLQTEINLLNSRLSDVQTRADSLQTELILAQAQVEALSEERNRLRNEKASLEVQVTNLEIRVGMLEDFIDTLNSQTLELVEKIDGLEIPEFGVEFESVLIEEIGGTDRHEISGSLANFGTEDASNVEIVFRWIRDGEIVHTETLSAGEMVGRSIQGFNATYLFEGAVDLISWEVRWNQ